MYSERIISEKFARELSKADLKCNDGWISRFKNRHNISLGKISGEANSVNCADVRNWIEQIWNKIKVDYKENEIFNIDETGLFYNLTPDKILSVKGEKCIGGKLSKERVTVLVGVREEEVARYWEIKKSPMF